MKSSASAWLLFAVIARCALAADPAEPRVAFNRDIRPILSDVCFQCHGPDKNQRKADLRLDLKDDVYKDRGGYALVVPGKPDESEVFSRLIDTDEKQRMPPPDALRQLTKTEIDLFRRWIEKGAEWQGHWAYIKPHRPLPPQIDDERGFFRHENDRFVILPPRE